MKVFIPGPLRSYTREAPVVRAEGKTIGQVLSNLDDSFPGFRFRIIDEQDSVREHIKVFVRGEQVWDLSSPVQPSDEVQILCALSGG